MTHSELLVALMDKIPKMNAFDVDILEDIIAGLALKDNSLYDFYKEVITSSQFVDIALIEKIAKKYSVPNMYRSHIDNRFEEFKMNIKSVCVENKNLVLNGKQAGLDPSKWFKDKKPMFASTEKMVIERVGGIESICNSIMNVGYFDYLKTIFESAATDVSKIKYAQMMTKAIEHKNE